MDDIKNRFRCLNRGATLSDCPGVLAGVSLLGLESDGAPLTMQIAWSRRRNLG